RHPRLSRDGQRVVFAQGDGLVWLDRKGQVLGRHKLPGGAPSASHPDLSPDGRWVVSGGDGLYLTAVAEGTAVALGHPLLRGARRATFDPDGRSLVLERGGRLYRLTLPREMGRFFAFQRASELLGGGEFGAAVRYLNQRPAGDRKTSAYHLLLGRALLGLRLYRDADRTLRRAAELDPADWRPPLFRGKVAAARGDWIGAERFFNQALALGPEHFEGYLHRAGVRAQQGRHGEAIEDYRLALDRLGRAPKPGGEAVLMGLLAAYAQEGRLEDALLLLLERGDRLSAAARKRLRTASAYRPLREDPRFGELMGFAPSPPAKAPPRRAKAAPGRTPSRAGAPFVPFRAKVYIDDNPNPIESEILADDGREVTIRAFGVTQKYRRERVRIVR
ncbi:MAG: hypothetical protein ACE5JJ_10425, partial [Nitrospinota bacterium]